MSHQPERKEKDCLNCGILVKGRYCHICGQENIVAHQSFWGLVRHFIYDIFHFDGKFFDTIKYLLIRPGYVPREYIKGRRISFLDPFRMYLFTSAVFFLVFFSVTDPEKGIKTTGNDLMKRQERFEYSSRLYLRMNKGNADSTVAQQLQYLLDTSYRIVLTKDSSFAGRHGSFPIHIRNENWMMVPERSDALPTVKPSSGAGWLDRKLTDKWNQYKEKYGDDTKWLIRDVIDSFMHKFPYILFVSLPFFALMLKLLYIRRKNFFYTDHAIFTLYQYILSFIILLFFFLVARIHDWSGWGFFRFLSIGILLSGGFYLYKGMRRFYGQRRAKTIIKFLLLNLFGFILLVLLMLLFVILSIFQL